MSTLSTHDATAAEKRDLRDLDRDELVSALKQLGEPAYRAGQIFRWLHLQHIDDFEQMRNIPAKTRQALATRFVLTSPTLDAQQRSHDGTTKLRWRFEDGACIETVFIPDAAKEGRHALCISTQVGCAMGCRFCATATLKLKRNLHSHEIVNQVRCAQQWLSQERPEDRIGSLVLMGMGEPLHNYEAVVRALHIFSDADAYNFSPRRITVSTAGLTDQLARLLDDVDVQIAVSLVAARDQVRSQLMPINSKYPVKELIQTCIELPLRRRRRITFEVVLVGGVNDSDEDAVALAKLVAQVRCKVNLIPFNPHPYSDLKAPSMQRVLAFQEILRQRNIGAFLRHPRGQDIAAACGTLVARDVKDSNDSKL